jgi:hypothetical protein
MNEKEFTVVHNGMTFHVLGSSYQDAKRELLSKVTGTSVPLRKKCVCPPRCWSLDNRNCPHCGCDRW